MPGKLVFVDTVGGGLAAMAAAIAETYGFETLASTSAKKVIIPPEVATVLAEINLQPASVMRDRPTETKGTRLVYLGAGDEAWPVSLHVGDGDLEKLASARIARDRIERHLMLMH